MRRMHPEHWMEICWEIFDATDCFCLPDLDFQHNNEKILKLNYKIRTSMRVTTNK